VSPAYVAPTVRVLVLEGFISRPGYAARPGEFVDVSPSTANTAIAQGKARLPTSDDIDHAAPHEPGPRDPLPLDRDPIKPRRKR
jgi:hypothetical protein